mgnify:CR=1 FL=1
MATPSADRCALLQVVGLWAEPSVSMCLQKVVAHCSERRWALHSAPSQVEVHSAPLLASMCSQAEAAPHSAPL